MCGTTCHILGHGARSSKWVLQQTLMQHHQHGYYKILHSQGSTKHILVEQLGSKWKTLHSQFHILSHSIVFWPWPRTLIVLHYELSSVRMVMLGAAPLGKDLEDGTPGSAITRCSHWTGKVQNPMSTSFVNRLSQCMSFV